MPNENFKIAEKILGKKLALQVLRRIAKKSQFFKGQYLPQVYEDWKQSYMQALPAKATSYRASPVTYRANQKALHALAACVNLEA